MAEKLSPDHWDRYTQLLRGWQHASLMELRNLQRRYNHSGPHTYQRTIGCEMLEDGSTTGFLQYAYDGQDFLVFNKDTLSWIAVDNVAHVTKQAWEANRHELQYQKNWLEEECVAWLKRFLEYGNATLQRTGTEEGDGCPAPPELQVVHTASTHLGYIHPTLTSVSLVGLL
ncbi:major histocompatibility complex class I-related protein 1-like [Microcebus murinus]|uniref:major histocompatibility complex class I-related protein 1-like n=1 Tax=Microcebus murinus TaxID=30608 RepID=UPI003F6C589A